MFNSPSRRVYLGRLPPNFVREDVEKHLASYGTIVECKVMEGFGFVEFLNLKDAQDVVETFSRRSFLGEHIVMEFAKPPRRHDPPSLSPDSVRRSPIDIGALPVHSQPRHCIWVFNLSQWTRWQDLKDFGRTAGFTVLYSDIDSLDPTLGFIEYPSNEDATAAARRLDKTELRGNIVRVHTQQDVNRHHAAKRSRSRSCSPTRGSDLCEEMARKQCDDHERDEWDTQRSDGGAYDENSAWWMYDSTRYY